MIEVLREIEHRAASGINGGNFAAAVQALTSIVGLAKRAQNDEQRAEQIAGTLVPAQPASQSSVQIEQAAKGPPRVTVKVYDTDAAEALVAATTLYDQAVAKYAAEARVPEGSAV